MTAQGNALGNRGTGNGSPEGAYYVRRTQHGHRLKSLVRPYRANGGGAAFSQGVALGCHSTPHWGSRALLVALALLAGCRFPWSAPAPANPVAILKSADEALADMAFTNVSDWPGARLFDYMDGAAEAYFKHSFVTLGSAETKLGKTDARVELFQFKAAANAKALFDESNDGKGKKLAAGLAGTFWEAREMEALFHRGPYFCRLIIYGSSPEAHKLLTTLAAAIDKSIGE